MRWNPVTPVGETNKFSVDFNRREKLVLIYGKDIPEECPFKLAFDESETKAVIELLTKAKAFFDRR